MRITHFTAAAIAAALFTVPAQAAHVDRPDAHAPIGVMGDHTHDAGEFMVSYRFMRMSMGGNRTGTDNVSSEDIVTTVPNVFFGAPMQPPTLRIVPETMDMNMHMFGAMYAPTDWLTLMAMGMYVTKTMDHTTFQGGIGTTRLGTFTTESKGVGDTTLSALIRMWWNETAQIHGNAGISLPTGSIGKRDSILTPMGGTPEVRLPYPMQLGSGTYDLKPGLTYTDHAGDWGWGAQWMSTFRIGPNDADYTLGDRHEVTAWASYQLAKWISASVRLRGQTQGRIEGRDPNIAGPVQTANPDFHGGDRFDGLFGVNLIGQTGVLKNHRLAIEFGLPLVQDLNGPQMETDWTLTIGWQRSF